MSNNWYEKRKINQSHVLYERLTNKLLNQKFNILKEMKGEDLVKRLRDAVDKKNGISNIGPQVLIRDLDAVIANTKNTPEYKASAQKLRNLLNTDIKAQLWLDAHAQAVANGDAGAVSKLFREPETIIPNLKSSGYMELEPLPEYPPKKSPETPAPRPEEPSPAPGKSPEDTKPKPNVEQQVNLFDEFFQKRGITGVGEVLDEVNPETIIPELAKQKTEQGFISQLRSSLSKRFMSRKDTIDKIAKEIADLLKGKFPFTIPSSRGYVKQLLLFLASIKFRSYLLDNGTITTDKEGNKVFIVVDSKGNRTLIPADWTLDIIQYFINPLGAIAYGTKDFLLIPFYDLVLRVIGKKDPAVAVIVNDAKQGEAARPQPPATSEPAATLTWQTAPDGTKGEITFSQGTYPVEKTNGTWIYSTSSSKAQVSTADLNAIKIK